METGNFIEFQYAIAHDEAIKYGEALDKIEKEFISEAKKIGKKYKCFFEAMRDDNALYVQLQPAMDFSKDYKDQPTQQEMVDEFKKFRSELNELANRLGCKEIQYVCDPDSKSISNKDKDGRDYMNFLCTSVKEETYKKAAENAVAQDAAPKHKKNKRYIIDCNDADGNLLKLIQLIQKNGNIGHSFSIVVDPDSNGKSDMTVGWDGDGSDYIRSITACEEDDDLLGILLANVNTIRWIANGALPNKNYPEDKPDDPIEALKKIECTCDTLLDGNVRDTFRSTKELCKLIIERCNTGAEGTSNPEWTDKEELAHIKKICEDHLNEMDKVIKQDGSQAKVEDGFLGGLFNRSEAAKKGWETRKQHGWNPKVGFKETASKMPKWDNSSTVQPVQPVKPVKPIKPNDSGDIWDDRGRRNYFGNQD